jgi:Protein of unknown function DUF262
VGEPAEEYFENEATGVEVEPEDGPVITEPWDPDQIRVNPKNFSLRNILDMIDEKSLDLAPDFQRRLVWKLPQKSRLVESVLLQIPLPAFYFSEEPDGIMRVVDGLQRLSTIQEFCQPQSGTPGFALTGLEYLKDVEGSRYDELALPWKRRILNTQIAVNVIDPTTPDPVKFDIFKRINTGGSPLNAQEIRHCMSGQTSRNFLKRAVGLEVFHRATGEALRDHVRMVDREVALRFFAFYLLDDINDFSGSGTMDAFLTQATRKIDHDLDRRERERLLRAFERAMDNAYRIFAEHAFRKWPLDRTRLSPINRALFESWGVALSLFEWAQLKPKKARIVREARRLMTEDREYVAAISVSTGDPKRVTIRFERVMQILEGAVG